MLSVPCLFWCLCPCLVPCCLAVPGLLWWRSRRALLPLSCEGNASLLSLPRVVLAVVSCLPPAVTVVYPSIRQPVQSSHFYYYIPSNFRLRGEHFCTRPMKNHLQHSRYFAATVDATVPRCLRCLTLSFFFFPFLFFFSYGSSHLKTTPSDKADQDQ